MKEEILCLEPSRGRFVLTESASDQNRFFLGLKDGILGDHKSNYNNVKAYFESLDQPKERKILGTAWLRMHDPLILESLKDAEKNKDIFLDTSPVSGGHYEFDTTSHTLRLYGKSLRYGAPTKATLKEFEQPIRKYCKQHKIDLERVIIDLSSDDPRYLTLS